MSGQAQSHSTPGPLKDDDMLEELRKLIDEYPKLEPLMRLIEPAPPTDKVDEERAAFAGIYQTIKGHVKDFEGQLDNDVPNELKPFIHAYGHPEEEDEASNKAPPTNTLSRGFTASLTNARPLSKSVVQSSFGLESAFEELVEKLKATVSDLPQAPNIPLPPSPLFHDFAKDIVSKAIDSPHVNEGDGKPMKYIPSLPFENWGLTVQNTPSYTFIARTEVGLQNLVKWATVQKKKIRVAGYRHTWTEFYSAQDEVLVMMLPLEYLIKLPAYSPTMQEIQKNSDLVGIEIPPVLAGADPNSTLCTIKAGTTNDMFRQWCLDNRRWCIPFNVIMVEVTFGGTNGPICHGAGFSSTTLSDLVEEFHYIDPAGNPKTITDREQLRAASGCFGLLGICTAVTLRLDAMAMAVMNPVKLPLPLAIPPPPGFQVPPQIDMSGITRERLEQARKDFIQRCEEDYYLEWFWFPRTDQVWVNTWKKESVDQRTLDQLKPYPSPAGALAQWVEGWAAQTFINTWVFKLISPKLQTWLLSHFALKAMPDIPEPENAVKTLVSEALHFRRGIQNMRVRDCEWEIPIPEAPNAPGKRDYEKVQWAWWDAIKLFYEQRDNDAMRLTLEMRLTGESNVLLAPQRGNTFGTISIEALTTTVTPTELWQAFLQQLTDKWTGYKDSKGQLLTARPHWAKEWKGLLVRGEPIDTYLKETAYKSAISDFVKTLEVIAKAQGTSVSEMRAVFGNPLLEQLVFTP